MHQTIYIEYLPPKPWIFKYENFIVKNPLYKMYICDT